ncbi:MAG: hypothetical protein RL247_304 [Actinomycetota bacterium]
MQRLGDGSWVISASDLTAFSACPWRVGQIADQKLGKDVSVPESVDPMMELVARLGLEHEQRQLEALKKELSVVELSYEPADPQDASVWLARIEDALRHTVEALSSGADALFQATLFEATLPSTPLHVRFQGFADFIVKTEGEWEVWDSKLARKAKDEALLQLAAYVDQLHRMGVTTASTVRLLLGDGTHSIHLVEPLLEPYRAMRGAVIDLLHSRTLDPEPLPWNDETYSPCGTKGCPSCQEQSALHDDLFQISGIRKAQRDKLILAGFPTLKALSVASRDEVREATSGIGLDTLAGLHLQASLQVATRENPGGRPAWEVLSAGIINNLPAESPGDLYFDFEGDPTYQEFGPEGSPLGSLSHGDDAVWFGIEYLFGMWGQGLGSGTDYSFLPLWAESFDEERRALESFLDLIAKRYEKHPGLHVYHYAPYERTRLKAMSTRHQLDTPMMRLLLDELLIDLYPVVTKGVKIGLPSYSLKSLEKLYFEPETRTGIAGGGESVVAFSDYLLASRQGDTESASALKNSILHYNEIDCISTKALRTWLTEVALSS